MPDCHTELTQVVWYPTPSSEVAAVVIESPSPLIGGVAYFLISFILKGYVLV